jgi:ribosomal protein S18 acetylase RimI-like enzyme
LNARPLTPDDARALAEFFDSIPESDRNFFKEDVQDPDVQRRWAEDQHGVRLAAFDADGRIEVLGALWPGLGRSAHVADLRLIVATRCRRQGLGRSMAREALLEGLRRGSRKISVDVVAEQQGTINMFCDIGFRAEALLRCHLREPDGQMHDIVTLAHVADEAWTGMLTAGLDAAVSE